MTMGEVFISSQIFKTYKKIHLKNTFKSLILWQFWLSVGQIGVLLSWFCPLGPMFDTLG